MYYAYFATLSKNPAFCTLAYYYCLLFIYHLSVLSVISPVDPPSPFSGKFKASFKLMSERSELHLSKKQGSATRTLRCKLLEGCWTSCWRYCSWSCYSWLLHTLLRSRLGYIRLTWSWSRLLLRSCHSCC